MWLWLFMAKRQTNYLPLRYFPHALGIASTPWHHSSSIVHIMSLDVPCNCRGVAMRPLCPCLRLIAVAATDTYKSKLHNRPKCRSEHIKHTTQLISTSSHRPKHNRNPKTSTSKPNNASLHSNQHRHHHFPPTRTHPLPLPPQP
jgi:hypothetical protein